ncbi:MAG: hypothetical protein HY719_17730 [Planctomycetes bacterium]|nr:hypothetical protein [Planctomycetota bacterium]
MTRRRVTGWHGAWGALFPAPPRAAAGNRAWNAFAPLVAAGIAGGLLLAGCGGLEDAREELNDEDADTRVLAARTLGEEGDGADVPRLLAALDHERDLEKSGKESRFAAGEDLLAIAALVRRGALAPGDRQPVKAAVIRALDDAPNIILFPAMEVAGAALDDDLASALMRLYNRAQSADESLVKFKALGTLRPAAATNPEARRFFDQIAAQTGEPEECRDLARRVAEEAAGASRREP